MIYPRRLGFGLGFTSALAFVPAMPAFAQTGASGNDIIVTARRVEERLQDVPISITVYTQEQLSDRNVSDAADLAAYTPSLSTNNVQGSLNTSYSLRGFVQDLGTQPSVGVYFADVVAPRAAANQFSVGDGNGPGAFMDLQNVQVLKGPQGTLFGRNTTGGAILLVPKKPTGEFEGYAEASYGNYDMMRLQGALNVPLSDIARFRIAGEYQERDGYLNNYSGIGPDSFNDIGYYSLRASLVVDLTPDLENYTIATFAKADQVGTVQKVISAGTAAPYGPLAQGQLERAEGRGFFDIFNPFSQSDVRLTQWQLINTTTWRASDNLTVKNIVSYAQLKQTLVNPFFATDFDISDLNPLLPAGQQIYFSTSNDLPGMSTANQSTFTEEFQLQGLSMGGALTWQTGAYFESSSPLGTSAIVSNLNLRCPTEDALLCANPLGFGATSITANRTQFRNVGLYAQATYDLTDQLALTGGLRYTWDRITGTGTNLRYLYPQSFTPVLPTSTICVYPDQVPDCTVEDLVQKSDAPTWLLGLDFKPMDDLLLYAKWVRGFRAGNLALGLPAQFVRLRPEKLDMYEVGLKASFQGAVSGYFNAAAFYNDFSNQQASVSFLPRVVGSGFSVKTGSTNIGKSRIYGAEVEASATFFDSLRFDVSYAYLNTKVKQFNLPTLPADSPYRISASVREGDQLQFTPDHKLSLTATYSLPVPESVGDISIGGTYTYTDSQATNYNVRDADGRLTGQSLLAERNIFNLNLNWEKIAQSQFDLSLFMTNVTNEKYYTYLLVVPNQLSFANIGQPRMYGARLRYNW